MQLKSTRQLVIEAQLIKELNFADDDFSLKYTYVLSFKAGICISNTSFKWMKNRDKEFSSSGIKTVNIWMVSLN